MNAKTPLPMPLIITIFTCLILLPAQLTAQTLSSTDNSNFQITNNGATLTCDAANNLETALVTFSDNSTRTFTKRNRSQIDDLLDADENNPDLATTCTSGITDMSMLFSFKTSFNQDIGSWDVSSVTDMRNMFDRAEAFNQDIGGWDVSSVTDMREMFESAITFNGDIGGWDVSSVTRMGGFQKGMFKRARSFNQDIGGWDVSSVTNMRGMFVSANAFNQDIGEWDVSSVTNMREVFQYTDAFNQDIGEWDVSNVENMGRMFEGAISFNQDIGGWDVSNVVSTRFMFTDAEKFNQDIGDWNVSNVTTMEAMFSATFSNPPTSFNHDIGDWDVSNVEDMNRMFARAEAFNQDIGGWDVSSVTDMGGMFSRAEAFDQDIGTWNVSSVTDMSGMFLLTENFSQDIGDWDVTSVTNMGGMFRNADAFNGDIGGWDVSSVENMSAMFSNADAFNGDIGGWDVSSVENMGDMFVDAKNFNQVIGGWDVSNVTNMIDMFRNADAFNQDIGGWDVSEVTNMSAMFFNAFAFNQDIGDWDVSQVVVMSRMFEDASSFNQDLSTWCVEQITSVPRDFDLKSGFEGQFSKQPLWGTCPATAHLTGVEGFRLLSLSRNATSFNDLVAPLWTQGISNGADVTNGSPNVWTWKTDAGNGDASNYNPVSDLTNTPGAATGFLMYVFEDDDFETAGIQGGFPKNVAIDAMASGSVSPDINSNSGGFTLLGNPYANTIDFDLLTTNGLTDIAYVWNPATNNWDTWPSQTGAGDLTDGLIAPLQGFFVETSGASPDISIEEADKVNNAGQFRGKTVQDEEPVAVRLELNEKEGGLTNSAWLSFSQDGNTGERVRGDALKLSSLADGYAQLATTKTGSEELLDINHLPVAFESTIEIPLTVNSTRSGSFSLKATDFNIPEGFSLIFNNHNTGESQTIGPDFETSLTVEANRQTQTKATAAGLISSPSNLKQTASESESAVYSITIEPDVITSVDDGQVDVPNEVELQQNFPNPFNPSTTIQYALPEQAQVNLTVYDMLGQQVATLLSGQVQSAGSHSVNFDASNLSSGMYIYRLQAGSQSITRKMILLK